MYILSKSNIPEWVFPYPGRIITPSRYDDCRKTTSYNGQAIAYLLGTVKYYAQKGSALAK